jgi:Lrp/AsnC family leucine-responsive transcriptional regulator
MGTSALDAIDTRIIGMLVDDARLSTRAIARAVGMSPTGVSERLERLRNRGVIRGYHADIDPTALGWDVEAIIGITTHQGQRLRSLVDHLMTFPEVITAYIVTGRWDMLLSVRARSHQELQEFVVGTLAASPGFLRSETMVCWEARRRSAGGFLEGHGREEAVNATDETQAPAERATPHLDRIPSESRPDPDS